MRHWFIASLFAVWPLAGVQAAVIAEDPGRPSALHARENVPGQLETAQYAPRHGARPRGKARPAGRPAYGRQGARPGGAYRPRPGVEYRPRPGVEYRPGARPPAYRPPHAGYRPPPGYRPPAPGWRPPPGAWRPAYPGWRPGWNPAPWYGNYWRPGYGWVAAAGLVAVGVLWANAAMAYSVPPPPNPDYCWFYTDQTYQTGYWAPCPPQP